MTRWDPQQFRHEFGDKRTDQTVENCIDAADRILMVTPNASPVFSLRHLAHLTSVPYSFLRSVAERNDGDSYRSFAIRKRPLPSDPDRYRVISVPSPWLMSTQRWIDRNILGHARPHSASVAYCAGNSIVSAACNHCGARWLIKLDIKNFFETISESQVYRVFRKMGYQRLVSFELARVCTRLRTGTRQSGNPRFNRTSARNYSISRYYNLMKGYLPQGAPTSPRLSNLVARQLDRELTTLAREHGLIYTRYADDLTFSTKGNLRRTSISTLIGSLYSCIATNGFSPNVAKTGLFPPGSRKIVLGLLVDRDRPKLKRDFKANVRRHVYFMKKFGIAAHAKRCGNGTTIGLQKHVLGLIQFARSVEPEFGDSMLSELRSIPLWIDL